MHDILSTMHAWFSKCSGLEDQGLPGSEYTTLQGLANMLVKEPFQNCDNTTLL